MKSKLSHLITSSFSDRSEKHKLCRIRWVLAPPPPPPGSTFVEIGSTLAEKNSNMSQPIRGHGGHFGFPMGLKRKLGRRLWDLTSGKFRLVIFGDYRLQRRSEKYLSIVRREGGHLGFSIDQEKNEFGLEDGWDLASCQVSLNSI